MKRLCVIGNPIEHSLSPIMHNAAIQALNLQKEFEYDRIRVKDENLEAFIGTMRKGSIAGASVTMPHKEKVIPLLDRLTYEAEQCQSVNTIILKDEKIVGHNTDGEGCWRAIQESGVTLTGKNVVLLGAGGAAKAIGVTLANNGIHQIYVINRNQERAALLGSLLPGNISIKIGELACIPEAMKDVDILINATSVGMKSSPSSLIAEKDIRPGITVMDIVYEPPETALLTMARKAGVNVIDGLGMLVHQGAAQFEMFTERTAPVDVMKNAVKKFLSGG